MRLSVFSVKQGCPCVVIAALQHRSCNTIDPRHGCIELDARACVRVCHSECTSRCGYIYICVYLCVDVSMRYLNIQNDESVHRHTTSLASQSVNRGFEQNDLMNKCGTKQRTRKGNKREITRHFSFSRSTRNPGWKEESIGASWSENAAKVGDALRISRRP